MAEPKTGRRLILMDGTTIEGGELGYSDGNLWCWFAGYTFIQTVQMFTDMAKTGTITFEFGEESEEYTGFTDCVGITVGVDGAVAVHLKRGASA